MSDLCTFKIDSTVWNEFCQIDDHIVPHPDDQQANINSFKGDFCRRPCCGETCVNNFTDRYVDQEREQEHNTTTTLGKDSLCHSQNSLFCSSSDGISIRDFVDLISDNTESSGDDFRSNNTDATGSEFCTNDSMHNEKSTPVHCHSYSYPLGDTSQADNYLNFFDNFEDIDRMFRNCDSTFGLGTNREDELGCFISPNDFGVYRDVPKSDFNSSCLESKEMESILADHDPLKLMVNCTAHDSSSETASVGTKESSWPLCIDEFASHFSITDGPSSSDSKDEFTPPDQFGGYKKQPNHLNPSEGKRKEYTGNGSSFSYVSDMPSEVIQFPYGDASIQTFPYVDIGQQKQALGRDSYLSTCNSISLEKQVCLSRDDLDNHCDVEGVTIVTPMELCSSNIQESLLTSLELDDISPEAVSFRQLQHVTEQLDLRTKLCIRDGLYRLASSAERRQHLENLNSNSRNKEDSFRTFMPEGAKKWTGFMNMETDTNSVDRSIAHLLFTCP